MARSSLLNRLTKTKVEKAAHRSDKPIHDGGGLYFVPKSSGGWWKFKYRRPRAFGGAENSLSFGEYPHVDLKYARGQREDALKELARGIDPSAKRRADADAASNT